MTGVVVGQRKSMASYSTNEFRSGLKLMIDNDPCEIVENEFVKPGKGQAFNRVKLRNLKTGRIWERTYKSGESVEAADVVDTDMEFLYSDDDAWWFMNPESYDQVAADKGAVGENDKGFKNALCIKIVADGRVEKRSVFQQLPDRSLRRGIHSLAREMYSPLRVSTLSRSPSSTNNGTLTTAPVSRVAGLLPPWAVSPLTPGSVSVTVNTT